ncbi:MAG TPA: DUF2065 domain-containing protein [Gammaproteobacteria bacterium]|nr:DUF2065 domain-containing protein [Gammaproteobacteria bacterium]
MWQDLMAATALVFVFEGMLPFLSPTRYRRVMSQVLGMPDARLRVLGLLSMILGLVTLYLVR